MCFFRFGICLQDFNEKWVKIQDGKYASRMWDAKQSGSWNWAKISILGSYYIFAGTLRSEWALIRGGRLFEVGRLLSFHHFQQV